MPQPQPKQGDRRCSTRVRPLTEQDDHPEDEQQQSRPVPPINGESVPGERLALSTNSKHLQERSTSKRAQLLANQGTAHPSNSVATRSNESVIRQDQPASTPASESHTTRGWVISDLPPLDSISSMVGRGKRDRRGYTSIIDPNLRLLTQATAVWAEKTILFDDAFPPGDESVAFWDEGCWAKAQQQLELNDACTKRCRRVVRVQSSETIFRLIAT